jgi:nondiscriminating glutamyl-tRNA synthetase
LTQISHSGRLLIMFRTRQAPSPTGYLHFGTARTMLFTKLFALCNSGTYYLRLEDTDRTRLNQDAAIGLIENLAILGLSPDEGVSLTPNGQKDDFYGVYQKGSFGPYIQSERLYFYHKYAQKLVDNQLAYWAYLTPEDKQELQEFKQATKKPINYLKKAADKNPENLYKPVSEALKDESKPALMYKLQRPETIECVDELLGKSKFDLALEEDFVILKSDGFPTYHFAHLVDDYEMQTNLVIRAQEWFPSLPKHVTMFQDCKKAGIISKLESWTHNHPNYLHLPFILGETGNTKMSKRDGNVNMADYLAKGYLPEAIINYLAFLGWNPGTEKELYLDAQDFTLSQQDRVNKLIHNLAADFGLEKLSKSPARFNLEKLNWFNREYIKLLSLEEFTNLSLENRKLETKIEYTAQELQAYNLDKNRITTLSEFGTESSSIINWQKPSDEDIKWKKITIEESKSNLKEITNWLTTTEGLQEFMASKSIENQIENTSNLETAIKAWLLLNQKDTGSYLWPLRVALSGKSKSPSPFELVSILSKKQIEERINQVLE